MKKKMFAVVLIVVFSVLVLLSVVLYFQGQIEPEQAAPYTVIGTLTYAPGHAIIPGISVLSVSPSLSPSPNAITWAERFEEYGTLYNSTVDAFIFVNFKNNFTLPLGIPGFPDGFQSNNLVKATGEISYDETVQRYALNVTSISHYLP